MTYYDMTREQIEQLLDTHNSVVKEQYMVEDLPVFEEYIANRWDAVEDYIEISSNETDSGNPFILEL